MTKTIVGMSDVSGEPTIGDMFDNKQNIAIALRRNITAFALPD